MASPTDNEDVLAIRLPDRPVDGGVIREASVSSSVASRNVYACPVCENGSVVVEGQFRRQFAEEFSEGQSAGYHLDGTMEKNILAVVCPECKVRYVIEPDDLFALREENLRLKIERAKTAGLNAIEMESDRVN